MKLKYTTIALLALFLASCTIYRSPQRKEFESESSNFRVQNLKLVDCTHQSIRSQATSKRLVTVLQNAAYSDTNIETEFLWEYLTQDSSVFESDNLKGVYCVYQNS
jgi:hypothetical protein